MKTSFLYQNSAQTFTIHLLGTPAITWQATPFGLPRRQVRALLFRLAADPQPVSRDQLLTLFWPETAETNARRNLTRLLSTLRQHLPDPEILQTTRIAVTLNPDLTWSDAITFVNLAASDSVTKWGEAVTLYRGLFLSGFSLANSIEFDTWQSQQQYTYERRYLSTLARLVIAGRQAGQIVEAIDYAQRYLAMDDLSEEMHRHLIELYAQTGERSAALRQFEQCVIVLERELGVPPLPETRAAYESARDNRQLSTPEKGTEPEWTTLPGLDLPLIGREPAWEALATAYGRFHQGGVIFISGESGVGKSRLMQEFTSAQIGLVLTGNSYADGRTIPYQPLIQALRQALSLPTRWRHAAPIWLAEASRLLPELPATFPNLPLPVEIEAREAQSRLFEALTQLFLSLATDAPLLLCLDDVHWADEATHGWLQYIARRLTGSNVRIVATYRTHEVDFLREWRRTLGRANVMADVKLNGLSETAVASLLHQTSDDVAAPERLAARIHTATGGNAFFVLETVRELLETGQLADPPADLPLSSTVRETVLRRAGRLTPLSQQILEMTAVLSPLLTFPVIHEAAGRGDMETADSLEELVAHQLLLADDDQFRFQHDLVRDAVYQDISSWRRRLLHRRAAAALTMFANQENMGWAAATAVHLESAGETEQAITTYRQAADAAQLLYAHQEAINYLQRAIKLAGEASLQPASAEPVLSQPKGSVQGILPRLHEDLGDNLTISGDFPAAEKAYQTALSLAPEDAPLRLVELQRKLAATLPPQERVDEAVAIYQRALAHLEGSPPENKRRQWQTTRLNINLSLLDALYLQHQVEAMAELNKQVRALLDEVGTAVQQVRFYARLGQLAVLQNRFCPRAETIALAQTSLAYAQESGNVPLIARHQFDLGFHFLWQGNLNGAEEMLQQSLASAKEFGNSWLRNLCLVYLTVLYRFQGDSAQIVAYLSPLVEISHQVGTGMYIGVSQANIAWLHYRAGEWQAAQKQAETAVSSWAKTMYPFQWLAHWLLLAIARRQNRLPEAIAAARAMLDVKQQKLPDEVEAALVTAVSAWEADDEVTVRDGLETAVALAAQHGYL